MITKKVVEQIVDEGSRETVNQCLVALAGSKIFLLQIDDLQRAIMGSFEKLTPEALTEKIKEVQMQTRVLRGLHEFGVQIARERGVSL